jgi:hypothetical protein
MRLKLAATCLLLIFVLAPWAAGQTGKGSISGRIVDQSGGVVPGAKVAVINSSTGVRQEALTNNEGYFEALSLIPSTYDVEVQAPNFKTLVRRGILVQVEDHIGLELKLEVGQITESITITAEGPQLRTEDAQTGEVVTESMIQTLPSNNGGGVSRDPLLLLVLSGDVQGSGARAGTGLNIGTNSTNSGQSDTRINGGRTGSIEYYVDGVPASSNFGHNVSIATPAYDDVSEFKVVTNGISSEYGRLSGGAVSVTTKSGTNGLHGQLFEYNQQPGFNANTWNADASGTPKGGYHQNDFGFALGGPVILPHLYNGKAKTFWFANYDGVRIKYSGAPNFASIPTPTERTGDLSDYGVAGSATNPLADVWNPFAGSSYPNLVTTPAGTQGYQRTTELGNIIPKADLDPTVQGYMSQLPALNNTPIAGSPMGNDYKYSQPQTQHVNQWGMRIDQVITENQRLFFHFSHAEWFYATGPMIPSVPTSNLTETPGGWAPTLGYDWTINPTTNLELRVGGNFSPFSSGNILPSNFSNAPFHYSQQIQTLLGSTNNIVGLNGIDDAGQNVPGANAGGSYGFNGASSTRYNSTNAQWSGMLTKILGRHTLKFGYEGRRYYDNFKSSASTTMFVDAEAVGPYSNYDQSWGPQGNANGLGQFLLGVDSWLQITSPFARNYRLNYYASFVQDDFKVTPKLTLNLGLRWETESPITEKRDQLNVWDPTATPGFYIDPGYNFTSSLTAAGLNPSQVQTPAWVNGGLPAGAIRLVGTQQHPSSNANDWHPWNFAPRIGAAYQLTPKTVIRASYSILYVPTSGSLAAFAESPGINYTAQASSAPQQGQGQTVSVPETGLQNLQMPFVDPAVQITTPTRDNLTANYLASNLGQTSSGAISRYMHMPMESDWSLGLQYQLPWNVLVEADYVGNHSGSLLAKDTPSRFPKALYTGGSTGANATIYATQVANPFEGQGANNGPTVALGSLETLWPYFGLFQVQGVNAGTSNYNALNLRIQKRFSNGFQLLFNYTFSRLLDDVGGSDSGLGAGPASGYGQFGLVPQSVDTFRSTYGLDGSDQTNRISAFYDYQLPLGRGRKFMGSPDSFGAKVLDGFIGGWELSGNTVWHSGTPVIWNFPTNNQGSYGVFQQYATFAPGTGLNDLVASGFSDPSQARVGPNGPGSSTVAAFNRATFNLNPTTSKVDLFTYGNIPPIFTGIRNPGSWNSNLSILKNFPIFSADGSRYLQFRMEALNIFNHPGYGNYDANVSDGNFGLITGTANTSRQIQLALKFVF